MYYSLIIKKAIRIITSSSYRAPSKPLFDRLKLLTIENVYYYNIMLFMYKYMKGLLPDIFSMMFVINKTVQKYETRQANMLHVPVGKTSLALKCIRYKGVSLWNSLSDKILSDCNLFTYKK